MKKIMVLAVAMFLLIAGAAFAQTRTAATPAKAVAAPSGSNSLQRGNMGINVGMGDSLFSVKAVPMSGAGPNDDVVNVTGKYFVMNDLAILATFGFRTDGSDAGTYISIGGGVRKYLSTGVFNTFIDAKLIYASVDNKDINNLIDMTIIDISAMFGAEYFLARQFSLEGGVGLGFGVVSDGLLDDRYFGTRTVGVSANFYF